MTMVYTRYLLIDAKFLMEYFGKSRATIRRWIKQKKFYPTDIDSIVELRKSLINKE